jgi:hypothetical protein
MCVHSSVCTSVGPSGRISVKFDSGGYYGNLCRENPYVVKIGQKYRAFPM